MSDPASPRAQLREALLHLRVAYDDGDAVVADLLRAPRERELGPAQHRRLYKESREAVLKALTWLLKTVDEDAP